MRQMFTNQKGFSLLEVLIAISIFAVGLLALAQMQITSIQGNAFSSRTTDATTLAQDRLEQLMALAYTDADLNAGDHEDAQTLQGVAYTVSWNVTNNALINNTKTVIMTVAWSEGGRQRTLSMQFVKAQAG
jgi:type IV pilus assembly protein PilV